MPSSKEDYIVLETIGQGSFGTCQKIMRKADKKLLVWKLVEFGSMGEKEKESLVGEVNMLRELQHPNIVKYYDRIIDRETTTLYMVMELCEGGDLASLIKKYQKQRLYIEEEMVAKLFLQILQALQALHFRKEGIIVHRDIKPANIFLDAKRNIKLGDFGLARVLSHSQSLAQTCVGSPLYMAPEVVSGSGYNEKSDIWSLGCLLYELCALLPPFTASTQAKLNERIRRGRYSPIPSMYSANIQSLVGAMLNLTARGRPSIEQLIAKLQLVPTAQLPAPAEAPVPSAFVPVKPQAQVQAIAAKAPMVAPVPIVKNVQPTRADVHTPPIANPIIAPVPIIKQIQPTRLPTEVPTPPAAAPSNAPFNNIRVEQHLPTAAVAKPVPILKVEPPAAEPIRGVTRCCSEHEAREAALLFREEQLRAREAALEAREKAVAMKETALGIALAPPVVKARRVRVVSCDEGPQPPVKPLAQHNH